MTVTDFQIEKQSEEPKGEIIIEQGTPNRYIAKNHPVNQIIGSANKGVMTRNKVSEEVFCYLNLNLRLQMNLVKMNFRCKRET